MTFLLLVLKTEKERSKIIFLFNYNNLAFLCIINIYINREGEREREGGGVIAYYFNW